MDISRNCHINQVLYDGAELEMEPVADKDRGKLQGYVTKSERKPPFETLYLQSKKPIPRRCGPYSGSTTRQRH